MLTQDSWINANSKMSKQIIANGFRSGWQGLSERSTVKAPRRIAKYTPMIIKFYIILKYNFVLTNFTSANRPSENRGEEGDLQNTSLSLQLVYSTTIKVLFTKSM